MNRAIRFLAGYLIGITVFLFLIPWGLYSLSRLDYLFDYQMILNSMMLRYLISALLGITGIFFVLWSNIYLLIIGKGGPAEGFGVAISPRTSKLVTRGPYRFCRHPMVFGAFTFYMAVVIYLNSLMGLIFLVSGLVMAFFYLRNFEENRLLADFGEEYVHYKKQVPMILPIKLSRK